MNFNYLKCVELNLNEGNVKKLAGKKEKKKGTGKPVPFKIKEMIFLLLFQLPVFFTYYFYEYGIELYLNSVLL